MEPLRVVLLAEPDDTVARDWSARTGARLVHRGRHLLTRGDPRPTLVHLRVRSARLDRAVAACVIAGIRGVVASPLDDPGPALPALQRRVHRWVFPTDGRARPWRDLGIAPGRMVRVCDDDDLPRALGALWAESAAMAGALPTWLP